jgi:predicted nucleotide-binding protein (sugar kinase/HSP70/actin superfamily)
VLIKKRQKKIGIKILVSFIILIFISLILPMLIWTAGEKEVLYENRTNRSNEIYYFYDEKCYAELISRNKAKQYAVKLAGNTLVENFDFNKVQIVNIDYSEKPRFEEIQYYKKTRLNGNNIISKEVNDMFGGREGWKEKLLQTKIKLYIPSDSIKGI